VTDKDVPVAAAGGIDDEENPFGTDPMKILEAIQKVYSDDGVIVFMDLGSAILSTEMALDFLEENERKHVRLSAAPIVEGVASAAVQSGAGLSLDEVLKESDGALLPKQSQLSQQPKAEEPQKGDQKTEASQSVSAIFSLGNALGIHARPASIV
jgi:phosphocarrier protein FPr